MEERTAGNLELVGGWLCLDFINTVSTRSQAVRREYLDSYAELLAWGRHAGILTASEVHALRETANRHPESAVAGHQLAIGLRETIYCIFSAIAWGQEPAKADLDSLNRMLHTALSRLEVARSTDGFEWTWALDSGDLTRLLWPIVRSAAELLISPSLGRVRRCAREGCDWLFVDSSKNASRRWCSMTMCGSRVKAQHYYQRKKRGSEN
jgi:predicted RNA-binding Zn ribbon-like protein